ncbi:hypothetical protein ACF0H5_002332 [Mactra antiquata]
MGCVYSNKRKNALRQNKSVTGQPRKKYLPDNRSNDEINASNPMNNIPEFTDRQKELVTESWKEISKDLDQVGIQMFMRLFKNTDIMGCVYSKNRKNVLRQNKSVTGHPRKKYLPDNRSNDEINASNPMNNIPEFTDRQKELVTESWKEISKDLDHVGIQMFMR